MPLIRSLVATVLFLSSAASYGQYTDVINSNRPGRSMSAFSVGQTVFQTEFGVYGVKEKHSLLDTDTKGFGSEISFRYGAFLEQLEFIVDIDYRMDKVSSDAGTLKRSALRQTIVGAKYLIYDPYKKRSTKKPNLYSWKANNSFSWKELIPAIGIYAGANINLSDNEFSFSNDPILTPKIMLITQSQFGKNVFVTNFISEKYNTDYPSYSYVATLTHGFSEQWSGFVENQGIMSDFYSDFILRGGAAYLLAENFQIDASVGASTKTTPSIVNAAIGFSWRFDANYLPTLFPADGEKEGGKDEPKKEKKRKDKLETEQTNF